ncbi:MAG: EAL domain-containing protein, partial [Dehalococcoidia bacterium]
DKSFVMALGHDTGAAVIVQAISALATALGMDVTAEGIETEEQLVRVRALDCDRGQGYLFSKPAPACEVELLLQNGLPKRRHIASSAA